MPKLSPRVKWLIKNVEGKKILDIGFVGEDSAEMVVHDLLRMHKPESEIWGLDNNEEMVKASKWANCVVGSLYEIPFDDESFDGVVFAEVLEHLIDIQPAFEEMSRVLKKGGKLFLTTPSCYGMLRWLRHWMLPRKFYGRRNYRNYLGNDDHKAYWEPLSVCNLLHRAGLEVTDMTTKNLSLPYLPSSWRDPDLNFWPFTRMGTYFCLIAKKA
jgi:SAM-dependent methyltransferase